MPYKSAMHAVLTTDTFEADAEAAGLSEDEIGAMVRWLSANPQAGAVMQGTGGARKVRFAGKGNGKSEGYRTIHYYGGDDVPLFLLAWSDKGSGTTLPKPSGTPSPMNSPNSPTTIEPVLRRVLPR